MQPHGFCWAKISLAKCHFIYWWSGLLSASQLTDFHQFQHRIAGWVQPQYQPHPCLSGSARDPLLLSWPQKLSQTFIFPGQVAAVGVLWKFRCGILILPAFQAMLKWWGGQSVTECTHQLSQSSPATLPFRCLWAPGGLPRTLKSGEDLQSVCWEWRMEGVKTHCPGWRGRREGRRGFWLNQLSSPKAVPFICLRKVSMEKENNFFKPALR